ncbi:NUDIX domain-containing protein [Micromonospora sp. DR5-3]|uniref:NUDIX hydrolase n=1 Tax=unclassified Micromonospora TaxID=2617518 RepID=UPI0011D360DE|nr:MULTISPECIES: NUDIX domain-containing protein [unclassified Micromonospora]MCW3817295.1 NUDIX domain-containing protein [Micromonospora sp. DR5-3]TYC24071.1 NUDIX domain-containing protein [Micromonospora sp. MP36]
MSALTWAVAAVVTDQAGRVLLCRRSGPGRRWALPGGRPRRDESPLAAAVREIRAETGWAVDLVDLVGLYRLGEPGVPRPPAGRCGALPDVLVHVFRARVRGDAPAATPVGGDLCWYPPEGLPEALTPTTRAAVADALAGRSGVLREARPDGVPPGPRGAPGGALVDGEHAVAPPAGLSSSPWQRRET